MKLWTGQNTGLSLIHICMDLYGANPGRGGHALGMAASREVYRCRETAASFFHLDNPGHVVFTMNCTMSLNIVIKGLLRYGGHVVVSSLEHNAVLRPLNALSASGRVYSVATVVPGDPEAVSYTHLGVSVLRFEDGRVELLLENDNSHLSEELSTFAKQTWWKA